MDLADLGPAGDRTVRRWLRRPLLHFLLIGAVLFGVDARLGSAGRRAAPAALSAEELLYREARELGLHRSDPLVRRRLVRDMRFAGAEPGRSDDALFAEALALGLDERDLVVRRRLVQRRLLDLQAEARRREPSDAELAAFLRRNPERFALPARVELSQIFLSGQERGAGLEVDARALLAELTGGGVGPEAAADRGDPLALPVRLAGRSQRELAARFGPAFARAVFTLEPGAWRGPVASAYGLHLVWVDARKPARLPSLDAVRGALREAWLEERTAAHLEEKLEWLRAAG